MDFYIVWILASIGLATVVFTMVVAAWVFVSMWHLNREAKRKAQSKVEQRVSLPVAGKRDTSSAVALMDQVDAMIARLDEAELDADIDEMQMRGW